MYPETLLGTIIKCMQNFGQLAADYYVTVDYRRRTLFFSIQDREYDSRISQP